MQHRKELGDALAPPGLELLEPNKPAGEPALGITLAQLGSNTLLIRHL